ncbi:MAG: hypothetical protein LBQ15_13195 [Clostridium sp.]|jgi:hypothetical protein|nr:hypothetical protein [Clostridium sp.]
MVIKMKGKKTDSLKNISIGSRKNLIALPGTLLTLAAIAIFIYLMRISVYDSPDHGLPERTGEEAETVLAEDDQQKQGSAAAPIYLVEDMEDLHIGEPFDLTDYYLHNRIKARNYYYIDENNVLWGYGDNAYGQLGIGEQYTEQSGYDDSLEAVPRKIAEHVVHVDASGEYFAIYLTADGELYGMGANLNGLMGMEVPGEFDYSSNPGKTVSTEPVLLMEDVSYARCGYRSITALQKDGSVWWWGEFKTTSSKSGKADEKMSHAQPVKMMDGAVYVTSGAFSAGAIKEDGSLWTWGNNTFGSCGTDSGEEDFIREPVKALEQVKMVWFDSMEFNAAASGIPAGLGNTYACVYPYVTFVEKQDGSLAACGFEVTGEGSRKRGYDYYGDIIRPMETLEGERYVPVEVSYSERFQPIDIMEKNRDLHLRLAGCEYGWSFDELEDYLDGIGMEYSLTDVLEDHRLLYYYASKDGSFLFLFNEYHELAAFQMTAYGSRDGRLAIGMEREAAEGVLGKPLEEEDFSNGSDINAVYQMDGIYYTIYYHKGWIQLICESMYPYEEYKVRQVGEGNQ